MIHKPVLVTEVLQYLNPKPNENFIDATIGEGGHAAEILKKTEPFGKLLGIDMDKQQINSSRLQLKNFQERVILVNDSYSNLQEIVERTRFMPVHGILLDLGFSSRHLEDSGRGFTFQKNEALDMRYNDQSTLTTKTIINEWQEGEIEKILREFGEEKFSKQIARGIIEERKKRSIDTTFELMNIIVKARYGSGRAIPALAQGQGRGLSVWAKVQIGARTFQALRIAVNRELENVKEFLPQAIKILDNSGRLVIISFHSLEDRIVKNFFRNQEKIDKLEILTKKPIIASNQEILINPKARSAKLRAIIKI